MTSVIVVQALPMKCETTESIRKIQTGEDRDQQQAYQIPLVTRPFPIVSNDWEPGTGWLKENWGTRRKTLNNNNKTKENRSVGSTIFFAVHMLQRLEIKNSNLVCDCTYD